MIWRIGLLGALRCVVPIFSPQHVAQFENHAKVVSTNTPKQSCV